MATPGHWAEHSEARDYGSRDENALPLTRCVLPIQRVEKRNDNANMTPAFICNAAGAQIQFTAMLQLHK
jgi:hypothetical protein